MHPFICVSLGSVVMSPLLFLILVIWVFFLPWSLLLKLCYFLTFLNNQTFICWVYLWLFYSLFTLFCSNIYCWLYLPIWVQLATFPNLSVMCFCFHCPQSNSNQCAYHRCQSSSSWSVIWRPRRLSPKTDVLFISWDGYTRVGSQNMPGVTGKFCLGEQNESGQKLTKFCQEDALLMAYTLSEEHKRWVYTWTSPNGQHQNQIDYMFCSQRWRSCMQSAKTRPGADWLCSSAFRLKLKKVWKTTRRARCDWNPIPYEYAVEVQGIQGIRCS